MNLNDLKTKKKRGWVFPPAALKDIEQAIAINRSGEDYIPKRALARALKKAYDLPVKIDTIEGRLTELAGGRW